MPPWWLGAANITPALNPKQTRFGSTARFLSARGRGKPPWTAEHDAMHFLILHGRICAAAAV